MDNFFWGKLQRPNPTSPKGYIYIYIHSVESISPSGLNLSWWTFVVYRDLSHVHWLSIMLAWMDLDVVSEMISQMSSIDRICPIYRWNMIKLNELPAKFGVEKLPPNFSWNVEHEPGNQQPLGHQFLWSKSNWQKKKHGWNLVALVMTRSFGHHGATMVPCGQKLIVPCHWTWQKEVVSFGGHRQTSTHSKK